MKRLCSCLALTLLAAFLSACGGGSGAADGPSIVVYNAQHEQLLAELAPALVAFLSLFSATFSRAWKSAAAASAWIARFFHRSRFDSALASSERSFLTCALTALVESDFAFLVAMGLLHRKAPGCTTQHTRRMG